MDLNKIQLVSINFDFTFMKNILLLSIESNPGIVAKPFA